MLQKYNEVREMVHHVDFGLQLVQGIAALATKSSQSTVAFLMGLMQGLLKVDGRYDDNGKS